MAFDLIFTSLEGDADLPLAAFMADFVIELVNLRSANCSRIDTILSFT